MIQELQIRKSTQRDSDDIFSIHKKAFGQDAEARLVNAIVNSKNFVEDLSLVGCMNNKVVGHVLFSTVGIENSRAKNVLALAPVAVLPESQNLKIGTRLINKGIKQADAINFSLITVLGDPGYYHRFNFRTSTDFGITCPFKVASENFMVLPLANYDDTLKGKIVYPDHFNIV